MCDAQTVTENRFPARTWRSAGSRSQQHEGAGSRTSVMTTHLRWAGAHESCRSGGSGSELVTRHGHAAELCVVAVCLPTSLSCSLVPTLLRVLWDFFRT